jgi:beta-N-acetylhexosaminidase
VPVAKNLYLNKDYQNQIMKQIAESPVDSVKKYVYSDLHFYLYPEIVKNITGENFDTYLGKTYKALGANSLTFNPWSNTSLYKIVPTEYDSTFRQQLLRGFVHDEGAALMGGISGHAGDFSEMRMM